MNELICRVMSSVEMSTWVRQKDQSQFITGRGCFKDACKIADFQGKWMTAETWVQLISLYRNLSEDLYFDAAALNKAISNDRALVLEMDASSLIGIHKEHCGIFHKSHRKKSQHGASSAVRSSGWCYYATTPGNSPSNPPNSSSALAVKQSNSQSII